MLRSFSPSLDDVKVIFVTYRLRAVRRARLWLHHSAAAAAPDGMADLRHPGRAEALREGHLDLEEEASGQRHLHQDDSRGRGDGQPGRILHGRRERRYQRGESEEQILAHYQRRRECNHFARAAAAFELEFPFSP